MKPISSSDNLNISGDVLIEENIVLLNSLKEIIGTANKLDSHHHKTPFHLAFSIYLFNNEGKILVTKRAGSKKVWPGVWTNSCCGHPMPGETMDAAILRRCKFELGIDEVTNISIILPEYEYKTPPFDNIIENEFCPVYAGLVRQNIRRNPKEVSDYKWMNWGDFISTAQKDYQDSWSWWCKDQIKQLKNKSEIYKYIN